MDRKDWLTWGCLAALFGFGMWGVVQYTEPTAEATTTLAPNVNLDGYVVIALADSLYLCRKNGNGPLTMDCTPIPSGCLILVPRPRGTEAAPRSTY